MSDVKKRESWLDLIKVIATFLVILLHSVCNGLNNGRFNFSFVFYYIGVFAVPLFFMVNGYLQLNKNIDYKYIFKKIINILFICFAWNLIPFFAKLILKHNVTNIFLNIFRNFLQKDFFWHFWFLGALIIIYLCLPILQKIFKTNKLCLILTMLLVITCCIIDITNIYLNYHGYGIIKNNVYQIFRLWTWISYFMIGGCIKKYDFKISKNKNILYFATLLMVLFTIIYEIKFSYRLYSNMLAENFYDSIVVIITTILIFITFKNLNISENIFTKMGLYIMGIYIMHPMVIMIIKKLNLFNNNYINLIWSVAIFIICLLFSHIIYKIPYINKMIKI